jgi:hypothetical protein
VGEIDGEPRGQEGVGRLRVDDDFWAKSVEMIVMLRKWGGVSKWCVPLVERIPPTAYD